MAEIARDQRKQVGRLLVRIAPDGEVAAGRLRVARAFEIAVGQKHRRLGSIRLDPHAIGREHVGAIEKIGDAAKALRLALRAIGRARAIKPHELGVGRRIEARLDRERECASGRPAQQKARRLRFEIAPRRAARHPVGRRRTRVHRHRARAPRLPGQPDWGASRGSRQRASHGCRATRQARRGR